MRENQRARWLQDWHLAFREQGRNAAAAEVLTQEAATWATNNPDMTWQDVFDAVILADETREDQAFA